MYTVGSLADFISGKGASNKKGVQVKEVKYEKPLNPIQKNSNTKIENNINNVKQIKKKAKQKFNKNDNKSKKKPENKILNNAEKRLKLKHDKKENESVKITENKILNNEEKRLKLKRKNNTTSSNDSPKKQKTEHDENENNDRTIFIANINLNTKKKDIKKLFSKYGQIETVRFRGVPVADLKTPKQVALFEKKFHPKRKTMLAYIVFKNKEDAIKSKEANGVEFKDFHLRVDYLGEKVEYDQKKSLFVGNVPLDAEEDDIRKLFEDCGKIIGIRIVRDKRTNIGKGFCYVNFDTSDGVELALQLDDIKIGKRVLRLQRYSEKNKKVTVDGQKNRQKKTISLTNIPKEADETVIRKTFSEFGNIVSVKIYMKDENTKKCYLKFKTEASAMKASAWKMPKILGQPIKLLISNVNDNENEEKQNFPSIYVQNLPLSVTKNELRECFEGCGTIKSISVYNKHTKDTAVGFVNFETDEGVKKALKMKLKLSSREINITRKVSKQEMLNNKKQDNNTDKTETIQANDSDEEEAVQDLIENINGVKKWEDDSDSESSENDETDDNDVIENASPEEDSDDEE